MDQYRELNETMYNKKKKFLKHLLLSKLKKKDFQLEIPETMDRYFPKNF
jgi:hypothetical protein